MSWGCPGVLKYSHILAFLAAIIDTLPWTLVNGSSKCLSK